MTAGRVMRRACRNRIVQDGVSYPCEEEAQSTLGGGAHTDTWVCRACYAWCRQRGRRLTPRIIARVVAHFRAGKGRL